MSEPTFALTALAYPSMSAAGAAYERLHAVFAERPDSGDSLYRFALDGTAVIALVAWEPTPERLEAIAALPWGVGEAVVLPPEVGQQLARRSRAAAPTSPNATRRIHRGPTGRVLRDRTERRKGSRRR